MANSNKKRSGGLISNAFGIAKKLSETGLSVISHVAPGTVSKLTQSPQQETIVQGSAKEKSAFEQKKYDNPQQMMREHLPTVTGRLLGKHYKKINNVASFISPDLNDKLSDFIFDKLNDFVSEQTSVDALLKEVGAKNLSELTKDSARSQRISMALANQNKIIAVIQGALTGAIGGVGAMIDVPSSLALALRSIYHTGRAYGFELNTKDQIIVEYIFKEIDLGSVAEKQAILAAIRTFAGVLETHNVSQLQQILGSGNDIEALKRFIANDDGSFKLNWLNNLPHFSLLTRLTPLATMGVSAVYSLKLVDDATDKAQIVFAGARQYLIAHPDEKIDALEAYEKSIQAVSEVKPLLLKDVPVDIDSQKVESVDAVVKNESTTLVNNESQTADVKPIESDANTINEVEKSAEVGVKPIVEPKAKSVSVRTKSTTQRASQNDINVGIDDSVVKTPTSAKTVTKKRASPKTKLDAEINSETLAKSNKNLDNTDE